MILGDLIKSKWAWGLEGCIGGSGRVGNTMGKELFPGEAPLASNQCGAVVLINQRLLNLV